MKQLIKKLVTNGLVLLVVLESLCTVIYFNPSLKEHLYLQNSFLGISGIVAKSKKEILSDTIFIGDSVARQIFADSSAVTKNNYLNGNGSTLLSGNYYLIKNAVHNNPNITTIYLGLIPTSLRLDYNYKKTINNFVKPFVNIYNWKSVDVEVKQRLFEKPICLFYLTGIGKFAPLDELNLHKPNSDFSILISDFNKIFLKKIILLCEESNIELKLYAPPISSNRKNRMKKFLSPNFKGDEQYLNNLLISYAESFQFLDESKFKDGMHLSDKTLAIEGMNIKNYIIDL